VPTPGPLAAVEAVLTAHLGRSPARASMSFVGVDPVEVLRYETGAGIWTFASLGMSRQPMIAPSAPAVPGDGPRAELILRVRDPSDRDGGVWRRVGLLAAAPAVEGVVYTSGMTIDLGEPLVTDSRCTGAVIAESSIADVTTAVAWSRVNGAAALRGRWHQRGTDLLDLHRPAVALD
jgi:hypothetical protein